MAAKLLETIWRGGILVSCAVAALFVSVAAAAFLGDVLSHTNRSDSYAGIAQPVTEQVNGGPWTRYQTGSAAAEAVNVYTVRVPDGRKIKIEAADEATAIRGAHEWADANPKGSTNNTGAFDDLIPVRQNIEADAEALAQADTLERQAEKLEAEGGVSATAVEQNVSREEAAAEAVRRGLISAEHADKIANGWREHQ